MPTVSSQQDGAGATLKDTRKNSHQPKLHRRSRDSGISAGTTESDKKHDDDGNDTDGDSVASQTLSRSKVKQRINARTSGSDGDSDGDIDSDADDDESESVAAAATPVASVAVPGAHWHFKRSDGGLVTALSALTVTPDASTSSPSSGGNDNTNLNISTINNNSAQLASVAEAAPPEGFSELLWVGWCGAEIPPADFVAVSAAFATRQCSLVPLSTELADGYYTGFANSLLWPVLHSQPPPIADVAAHGAAWWRHYVEANAAFSTVVLKLLRPGDVVLVNDYHLCLVPALLAAADPAARVGWFLHTPFPPASSFSALPWSRALLRGVLRASVLGFHTPAYAANFRAAVHQLLGAPLPSPHYVEYAHCLAHLLAVPVGIAPAALDARLRTRAARKHLVMLRRAFAGCAVVLGVDRLDTIKGIPHKLLAFEMLLARKPQLRGKVALVQIVVPSRAGVGDVTALAHECHELAGRVNGRFGTVGYSPVTLLDRGVAPAHLAALYRTAAVCCVGSVRDGMNLVALEYLAAHHLGRLPLQANGELAFIDACDSAMTSSLDTDATFGLHQCTSCCNEIVTISNTAAVELARAIAFAAAPTVAAADRAATIAAEADAAAAVRASTNIASVTDEVSRPPQQLGSVPEWLCAGSDTMGSGTADARAQWGPGDCDPVGVLVLSENAGVYGVRLSFFFLQAHTEHMKYRKRLLPRICTFSLFSFANFAFNLVFLS